MEHASHSVVTSADSQKSNHLHVPIDNIPVMPPYDGRGRHETHLSLHMGSIVREANQVHRHLAQGEQA